MHNHNQKKTILFGGDICLSDKVYNFSDGIMKLFNNSDYSILNLEGPIIKNEKSYKEYPKAGPNIFQKRNILAELKKLKVSYVGGANNHLIDYGKDGIESTIKILKKNNIKYGGFGLNLEEAKKEINLENSNISIICTCEEEFGIVTKNKAGCYSMYPQDIIEQIRDLKKKNKFIIIYAHGGGEKIPLPSKYVINRYKEFINKGADLVVGHHPHVPQGFEQYNNKFIFYSLGNFAHKYFKKDWGILLQIEVSPDKLEDYKIIPVSVNNNSVDILTDNQKYLEYIKTVSRILRDKELFDAIHQEQSIMMYDSYYQKYFTELFVKNTALKNLGKEKIKKIFNKVFCSSSAVAPFVIKEKKDQLLLLHLIRNDSHKEFIETALKIKTNEIRNLRTNKSQKLFNSLNSFINNE